MDPYRPKTADALPEPPPSDFVSQARPEVPQDTKPAHRSDSSCADKPGPIERFVQALAAARKAHPKASTFTAIVGTAFIAGVRQALAASGVAVFSPGRHDARHPLLPNYAGMLFGVEMWVRDDVPHGHLSIAPDDICCAVAFPWLGPPPSVLTFQRTLASACDDAKVEVRHGSAVLASMSLRDFERYLDELRRFVVEEYRHG